MTNTATSITIHVDVDKLAATVIVVFLIWGILGLWNWMYDGKRPWLKETAEWALFAYVLSFMLKAWWDCLSQPLPGLLFEQVLVTAVFLRGILSVVVICLPKRRMAQWKAWANTPSKRQAQKTSAI